jgi:hypothetical protein
MFVIVWEYGVKPDRIDDFESFYRPDGPWTRFWFDRLGPTPGSFLWLSSGTLLLTDSIHRSGAGYN